MNNQQRHESKLKRIEIVKRVMKGGGTNADVAEALGCSSTCASKFIHKIRTQGYIEPHRPQCDMIYDLAKRSASGCLELDLPAKANGYNRVAYMGKQVLAHRLSWMKSNGEIPDGLLVLHKCDNRLCIEPSHLFLGTKKDNAIDMSRKGRGFIMHGEDCNLSRLKDSDVRDIRSRRATGEMAKFIAADYGLSVMHVYRISCRKAWKHIA